MRIVSCFSDIKEIPGLVKAGAGELYCAVPRFPAYGSAALLPDRDLKPAIRAAHGEGVGISLAVNSLFIPCSAAASARLLDGMRELDRAGLDAFIVSSPALLTLLKGRRLKARLHLSSIQPCFNAETARLFLGLGITRLILPNQLSAAEAAPILRLCRAAGAETEIFDYRFFGCTYVNGRCKLHRPSFHTFRDAEEGAALCRSGRGSWEGLKIRTFEADPSRVEELRAVSARVAARMGCGGPLRIADAGDFFDHYTAGTDLLKYGTRSDPSGAKYRRVAAMREMIALAGEISARYRGRKAREVFSERMSRWDPHGA